MPSFDQASTNMKIGRFFSLAQCATRHTIITRTFFLFFENYLPCKKCNTMKLCRWQTTSDRHAKIAKMGDQCPPPPSFAPRSYVLRIICPQKRIILYTQNYTCMLHIYFTGILFSLRVFVLGNKAHETPASWNYTLLGYTLEMLLGN